jgi:peptidyl-prolyl cis-trans isomerase B (cyclophilin B)
MSRRNPQVATKRERQRQLARQAHARRMQRRADRQRREKQIAVAAIVAVIVVAVGIGGAAAAGAFSTKTKPKANAAGNTGTSPSVTPSPSATPSPSSTAAMVDGKCVYTKSGTAARKVKLPKARPDTKATYTATIKTNRGDIVIDLLNSKAPCTVNSFVSLADQAYYNKTHCHRLTTSGIYVLQCGDPTGTGDGGPGYVFNSENLTGATYPEATVAMANTGQPDSNGSQFFLVYKNGSELSPDYTPFGTIVSGLNIIQKVAKAGSDNSNGAGDGHPKEKVEIDSVTIKKT